MFYTQEQLWSIGFGSIGDNVLISDKASIYNAKNIHVGSNVRIDDFCILSAGSGGIYIGNYVHIACMVTMIGAAKITLEDFSNVSGKCSIYSSSDDFSGKYLIGPTLPKGFSNVKDSPVFLRKYVILGCNTVVLPGVNIGEGAAIGALSLVSSDVEPYSVCVGSPLRKVKDRKREMVELSKRLEDESK
jgi:galactoside O-acetyltransferase